MKTVGLQECRDRHTRIARFAATFPCRKFEDHGPRLRCCNAFCDVMDGLFISSLPFPFPASRVSHPVPSLRRLRSVDTARVRAHHHLIRIPASQATATVGFDGWRMTSILTYRYRLLLPRGIRTLHPATCTLETSTAQAERRSTLRLMMALRWSRNGT